MVLLRGRDGGGARGRVKSWGRSSGCVGPTAGCGGSPNGTIGDGWRRIRNLREVVFVAGGRLLCDDGTRGWRCGPRGEDAGSTGRPGCRSIGDECSIDLRRVGNRRGVASRNRRRRPRVLEAVFAVSRETRTLRGTHEGLNRTIGWGDVCLVGVALRVGRPHLVPDGVVLGLFRIVFVEIDHVDGGLRVLLLLLLGNAVLLQHALPFLGETLDHG